MNLKISELIRRTRAQPAAACDSSLTFEPPWQARPHLAVPGHERVRVWLPGVWLAIAVCHWLARTEFELALLALTPLLFMLRERGSALGYVCAGATSIVLAGLDLVHVLPDAIAGSVLVNQPHRALGLLVMAWVLFRCADAYYFTRELSLHDPLTGLLNRRGFDELSQREIDRAIRHGRPVAFALLDVDSFKAINDRFGHAHGDRVLQCVAAELAGLRSSDLAVRLGGDEFGLLMPETDEAAAARVVARLKSCVHARMLAEGHAVSLSAGIASVRGGDRPMALLLETADSRMYRNKPAQRERGPELVVPG